MAGDLTVKTWCCARTSPVWGRLAYWPYGINGEPLRPTKANYTPIRGITDGWMCLYCGQILAPKAIADAAARKRNVRRVIQTLWLVLVQAQIARRLAGAQP